MSSDDLFGSLDKPAHEPLACPFCKSEDGYFLKLIISRQHHFTSDGIPQGGSEEDVVRGGKHYFCVKCEKDMTRHVKKALAAKLGKSNTGFSRL